MITQRHFFGGKFAYPYTFIFTYTSPEKVPFFNDEYKTCTSFKTGLDKDKLWRLSSNEYFGGIGTYTWTSEDSALNPLFAATDSSGEYEFMGTPLVFAILENGISANIYHPADDMTSVTISGNIESINATLNGELNTSIKTIELPSTIISLGRSALSGFMGLESVTLLSWNPPAIESGLLNNVAETAKIKILDGAPYLEDPNWNVYSDRFETVEYNIIKYKATETV